MSAGTTPPPSSAFSAGAARRRNHRRLLHVRAGLMLALPLAFGATAALAQAGRADKLPTDNFPGLPPLAAPQKTPEAGPQDAPRPRLPKDRRSQLEGLFAALKVAPDERSAKMIADRLDQIFGDSGSATADLMMIRVNAAVEAKQYDLALSLLDQTIALEPDYIGALSRRATILYMRDEYAGAMLDIREVLAREPRHFAMLYGLALIFRELGDEKRALDAVRRARAVNPRLEGAEEMERQLALKVEGRPI